MGMVYDEAEGLPKGFGVELRRESVRLSFEHKHAGSVHTSQWLGEGAYTSIELDTDTVVKLLGALNTPEWAAKFGLARDGYHYGPAQAMKGGRDAFMSDMAKRNPYEVGGVNHTYWTVGFNLAKGEALLRKQAGR